MDLQYPSIYSQQGSDNGYLLTYTTQESQDNFGGCLMEATGSSQSDASSTGLSMSSTITYNSIPATPTHAWGRPSNFEEWSPNYGSDNTPTPQDVKTSLHYPPSSWTRNQDKNVRATPSSLQWTVPSDWLRLYKFVVKKNGKERYFELLPGARITLITPQRVYLDQDQYVLIPVQ
jgi:hypothetical protein